MLGSEGSMGKFGTEFHGWRAESGTTWALNFILFVNKPGLKRFISCGEKVAVFRSPFFLLGASQAKSMKT